tara:strand:- start:36 stop:1484 length:1449 start_codon:yes stop_codon:yes gene_type:complete
VKSRSEKWSLQNSYLELPDCFYERVKPNQIQNPKLICFNKRLAKQLNLEFLIDDMSLITNYFSGNKLPNNSKPIAQAYAGHQFGHFTMLGDGRAILLGEQKDLNNEIFDVQLKGSGRTSFSRSGDGKATLSSMLREYLISESMHFLKIPTTRSLAVVNTGENIYRDLVSSGAVLTRIASSHIRVGTFEYGKNFCSKKDFKKFIHYVINRHYPKILNKPSPYLELLKCVMKKQIDLVVEWSRVGFIHGVMNTDNMSIIGETIDYGPCAFLNKYDPQTVFSSIDRNGRYAFGNQHKIAYWNLLMFAETILPFIDKDKDRAIQIVKNYITQFPVHYSNQWHKMMFNKLGILNPINEDKLLIDKLLKLIELYQADYTNTFASLTMNKSHSDALSKSRDFQSWKKQWIKRIKKDDNSFKIMKMNNPIYIPRNHLVESALENAVSGNKKEFDKLLNNMSKTYSYNITHHELQTTPPGFDDSYKTFCGT